MPTTSTYITAHHADIIIDVVRSLSDSVHWQHWAMNFIKESGWEPHEVVEAFQILANIVRMDNPMPPPEEWE